MGDTVLVGALPARATLCFRAEKSREEDFFEYLINLLMRSWMSWSVGLSAGSISVHCLYNRYSAIWDKGRERKLTFRNEVHSLEIEPTRGAHTKISLFSSESWALY